MSSIYQPPTSALVHNLITLTKDEYSYVLCLFGFKFSLLMSYLRFIQFGVWRVVTKVMAVVMILAHISFEFGFLLNCMPVRYVSGLRVYFSA